MQASQQAGEIVTQQAMALGQAFEKDEWGTEQGVGDRGVLMCG